MLRIKAAAKYNKIKLDRLKRNSLYNNMKGEIK